MGGGDVWRVLPYESATAGEHLARTEALWQEIAARRAPATIRWYGYTTTALVLGVGQSESAVERDDVRSAEIEVVKRTSGGTAVLADRQMVALDVALPSDAPSAVGDVVESYRWLGQALRSALHRLTPANADRLRLVAPAEARADQAAQRSAPPDSPESRRSLACFGVLSPYEVALTADDEPPRKLIGLSQIRKRGVVLYQAGVYKRFVGTDLARYLAVAPGEHASLGDELDHRIASLRDIGLGDAHAFIDAATLAIEAAAPPA